MRTWTRDRDAEEGGTHRQYVSDDGWIIERRYFPGNTPPLQWQVARDEHSYWEIRVHPKLSEAKAWVEAETEREHNARVHRLLGLRRAGAVR